MNSIVRNSLSVIGALIIGVVVNYGIILLGHDFFFPPEGVNPEDIASIKANVHLYSAKHFLVPFLAHAIGTLTGAYAISRFAVSKHKILAITIGAFFFLGGLTLSILLPEFWKYSIIDLILAYFPMAILGWNLAGKPE